MRVTAKVHVLAKIQKPWIDSNGTERLSFSINIMQEQGQVIDTLRLNQEQFNLVEANKQFAIIADYNSKGKNGAFLNVIDIISEKA